MFVLIENGRYKMYFYRSPSTYIYIYRVFSPYLFKKSHVVSYRVNQFVRVIYIRIYFTCKNYFKMRFSSFCLNIIEKLLKSVSCRIPIIEFFIIRNIGYFSWKCPNVNDNINWWTNCTVKQQMFTLVNIVFYINRKL